MSTNDQIIEAMTRHQVMIQRLGSGNYKQLEPILERMSKDIQNRLALASTDFQIDRLQILLTEVNGIMVAGGTNIDDELTEILGDFAKYEVEFNKKMVTPLVTVEPVLPPLERLLAAVSNEPVTLVTGKIVKPFTLKTMVSLFTDGKMKEVESIIRAGFIEGRPIQQIVRDIDRLFGKRAKRQMATLVRTATNHIASQARREFVQANRELIEKEEWVSTLDGRTTLVCMGRDGEKYFVEEDPYPPAHFGCRSVRVPIIKPNYSVFGTDRGTRASKDGPVSADLTYAGFLRKQSSSFQDDVLGPERAKLFRSGRVSIDRFTDDLGRTLTLDELRMREGLTLDT